MQQERSLLEEAWQSRDELYRKLFGDYASVSPNNYAPPKVAIQRPDVNTAQGGQSDPGDEDQRLTVLSYAPDPLRPYWIYVTSGLSNPWYQDEPQQVSGFGCEIMLKTPREATWPAQILRTMAFYVFNYATTLSPGVRIALNAPISVTGASDIQNLIIWYSDDAPRTLYQLPSGVFGLFTAIGVTADECKLAESIENHGTWCLQELLRQTGIGQLTDPGRHSVMSHAQAGTIVGSLKNYAANFPDKPPLEDDLL